MNVDRFIAIISLLLNVVAIILAIKFRHRRPEGETSLKNSETGLPGAKVTLRTLFIYFGLFCKWVLPINILIISFINFLDENLGYEMKFLWLIVSGILVIKHYYDLYRNRNTRPVVSKNWKKMRIAAWVILCFLAWHSGMMLLNASSYVGNYQMRIASILEHYYRLYRSPYLNHDVYRFLKQDIFNLCFYPNLYDTDNDYEWLNVYCYHLGDTGIIAYELRGANSYAGNKDSTTYSFVNYAESPDSITENIKIFDLMKESPVLLNATPKGLNEYRRGSAYYCQLRLGKEFHFIHWFSKGGAMETTKDYEGFVIDLRRFKHPPKKVKIYLFSNLHTYHEDIYELKREINPSVFILAKPFYIQADDNIKWSLRPTCDNVIADVGLKYLQNFDSTLNPEFIGVFESPPLNCEGSDDGEIFLVRYQLK